MCVCVLLFIENDYYLLWIYKLILHSPFSIQNNNNKAFSCVCVFVFVLFILGRMIVARLPDSSSGI